MSEEATIFIDNFLSSPPRFPDVIKFCETANACFYLFVFTFPFCIGGRDALAIEMIKDQVFRFSVLYVYFKINGGYHPVRISGEVGRLDKKRASERKKERGGGRENKKTQRVFDRKKERGICSTCIDTPYMHHT